MLGVYQSTRSLALIFGPIWAGFVFQNISPQAIFLSGAGLLVIMLGFALALLQQDIPDAKKGMDQQPLSAAQVGAKSTP